MTSKTVLHPNLLLPIFQVRKGLEYLVLLSAIISVCLVAYLHFSFISHPSCLAPVLRNQSLSSTELDTHILEIRVSWIYLYKLYAESKMELD